MAVGRPSRAVLPRRVRRQAHRLGALDGLDVDIEVVLAGSVPREGELVTAGREAGLAFHALVVGHRLERGCDVLQGPSGSREAPDARAENGARDDGKAAPPSRLDTEPTSAAGRRLVPADEAIPLPRNSLDVGRSGGRVAQRFTEPRDRSVQTTVEIDVDVIAPDLVPKLFSGDECARPFDEALQDSERLVLEPDRLAVLSQLSGFEVDFEVAAPDSPSGVALHLLSWPAVLTKILPSRPRPRERRLVTGIKSMRYDAATI